MTEQQPTSGWSSTALLLAAGSSGLLGLALGYKLAKRGVEGRGRRRGPKLVYGARLGPAPAGTAAAAANGYSSADSTPAATPRALSREDSAHGGGLRIVLLVRTDMALTPKELAEHSARTVLGLFKKQHKRRDPNLRPWEEGGSRIKVVAVGSQEEMLVKQAAARGLALATHTFAGSDRVNKQRTVMAIGPAPAEQLDSIILALPDLA